MTTTANTSSSSSSTSMSIRLRHPRRGGFSFVEVLFAVIVLGIGFIMIAAVFPVAISQTKTTTDETAAAAIAREGVNYLQNIPGSTTAMPATDLGAIPPIGAAAAASLSTTTIAGGATVTVPGKVLTFRD